MKTRLKLAAACVSVLLSACNGQNEAFVNADTSAAEDREKQEGDVHAALSTFADVEVQEVGAAGVPTFIRGHLGKVDRLSTLANGVDRVRPALATLAPMFRVSADDLVRSSSFRDELGFEHVRYTQTKNGLQVVGGELLVHIDREGSIYAANGSARDGVSLSPEATLSSLTAVRAALQAEAGASSLTTGTPRLVYLLAQDGAMSLAWEVEVSGLKKEQPLRDRVYINARNGRWLETHALIHSAMNRELHNLNHGTTLPGPLVRSEGGAANADAIVNTNYDRLGQVYNCYKTLFSRDSFDNAGAKLISSVHYSTNYVNAFWDGTQMVYGDGDGVTASNLATSLDVTAHELTHAVTERTAGLVYSGESGGLNESMSDVLGNACEAFAAGGVSANTWKVGEDVWTPATAGDALRYMNDPALDGDSIDYYPDYNSGVDVHYSSGLGNLAFYLASQGGTHPRGRSTLVVPGIGITKAQQIWYRALTVYMTSNTNFAAAKTAMKNAATDLYTATEVDAVTKAWEAVGVGITLPPPPATALSNGVPVTNLSGSTNSAKYFSLVVPAGQTTLTFTLSGGTGDADLYVRRGDVPSSSAYDCRPYLSGNAETCTFTSPTAATYYVMLNAYASYSGVSLTGQYSTVGDTTPLLSNGVPVTDVSGSAGSAQYWKLTVPAGQAKVVFTLTGQTGTTGDADVYVKRGAKPTTTTYDCRPYLSGSNETCTITSPVAGDYYVMLRGYTAFTKVTLKGQYP